MRYIAGIAITAVLAAAVACRPTAPVPRKIAITTSSPEARAAVLKGRGLAEKLRADEARPLFDEALAKDQAFALAHLYRAQTAVTTDEFFSQLRNAVDDAPQASEGEQLWIRAEVAASVGKSQERGDLLVKLVAAYPDDERAHVLLGIHNSNIRQYNAAIAEFRKAIQLAPEYAPAYNLLGYSLREIDQDKDAEAAFRKYIELIPNEPNPYDSLAELLMHQGRFDESLQMYRKALSIDPKFFFAHRGIAASLMYHNQPKEAMEELQKALEQATDDGQRSQTLYGMAVCQTQEGNLAAAAGFVAQAAGLSEKADDKVAAGQALRDRGDILLHAGKLKDAAADYARAVELIRQSNAPATAKLTSEAFHHGYLALVAAASRNFAAAQKEADAMLTGVAPGGNPNQIRAAQQVLGMVDLGRKNFDQAIAHFNLADTRAPYVAFHLAKAYEGKKDAEKAREWYRKAANANTLPDLHYAVIRKEAIKAAGA